MVRIIMNDDYSLSSDSNIIPAQHSANILFYFDVLAEYVDSLIVPGYVYFDGCTKVESAVDNYNNGEFIIPANAFSNEGMLAIAFAITTGEETVTTTPVEFEVRGSVNTSFSLPSTEIWQSMLQNFMDQYMDKVYSEEIRSLIDKCKELQASDEILQELINIAIASCGQYKFENGFLFFKQADGTYGEGINLNVSVEEFENIVRRVTSLETNGVAVGDTLPIGSIVYIDGDEKDLPTGYQKLDIVPQPPRQLLINNDFQVCQRGESLTLQNGQYCADMWRIYLNGASWVTLKKVENGGIQVVGFEGCDENVKPTVNLYQLHYNDAYYEDLKCTVVYSLNNVVNSYERILKNNSWDNRFCPMVSVNGLKAGDILNYADLYEGSVAYQHSKKSYVQDLLECQRYFKILRLNWAGYITTAITQQTHVFEIPMVSTPSVKETQGKTVISTIKHTAAKDRFVWNLYNSTAGNGYAYDYIYELSCEPL